MPSTNPISVALRPLSIDDAQALTRLLSGDVELALQTATMPIPYTLESAHTFLSGCDPNHNFAIILQRAQGPPNGLRPWEEELVGGCGFKAEPQGVEIGYWIGRPYWGRGYATAAVELLVEEARRRGLERLYAEVFAENPASMRVLEKAGFARDGEADHDFPQRGGRRRVVRFHREL